MQGKLNEWLLGALETLMLAHRHQISLLITDVVKSWDARDVSEKIELEIGKDLQYHPPQWHAGRRLRRRVAAPAGDAAWLPAVNRRIVIEIATTPRRVVRGGNRNRFGRVR